MNTLRRRKPLERGSVPSAARVVILVVAVVPSWQQSSAQRPQFEASVARVRVDVIVTDDEGRFVDDLGLQDFAVFEDGEVQEILDVQLVDLGAGEVIDVAGPTARATTTPERVGNARADTEAATERPARAGDLGAMIFLIDGPSLDPWAKRRFAREWSEWIEQTGELVVPRAVYAIASNGTLKELVPLTYEIESFRDAVDVMFDFPGFGISVPERMRELIDDMNDRQPDVSIRARGFESEEVARSLHTLEILTQFCSVLGARPGRTAVVWVSRGVKLTRGGAYSALTRYDSFDNLALDPRIREREEQLHQAANSANVSIYAVDPTSSSQQWSMGFDIGARSIQLADLAQSFEVQSALDSYRHSLQNAAIATGGQAYIQASDISSMLDRIEHDSSRFYLLAYDPPSVRGDGRYHEIRVEVSRPGVNVRERGGYVDVPGEDRHTSLVSVALAMPGLAPGLPVLARAARRWSPGGRPMVQLVVGVDTAAYRTQAGAAGIESAWDHFHARVLADEEEIVEESHEDLHSISGSTSGDSGAGARPFVYLKDWELQPGTYSIHVVLDDSVSGRLGATELEVEVAEPSNEWSTSDLILAVGDGVDEPQPLIVAELAPDEILLAYVEVSGGRGPVLSGHLLDAEGTVRLSQLPTLELERDRVGLHRGAMRFRGLAEGEYLLELVVSDPRAGEDRVFRERLHVRSRGGG